MKRILSVIVTTVLLTLSANAADVFSVKFGFTGVTQDEVNGQPAIQIIKATAANLINIARGRAPNATVPASEVLAAVLNCDAAVSLIVWDTGTHSVLATIATPLEASTVGNATAGVAVFIAGIKPSGNSSNSLNGGYLVLTGKASLDSLSGCPTKASFAVAGVIEVTTTDDLNTHTGDVLVLKGKLSLGSKIGTLP